MKTQPSDTTADTSLAQLGSPSNPVVVRLGEYQGTRFVDVRRHYKKKGTQELTPTRKGIALNAKVLADLRDILEKSDKVIQDWFSGNEQSTEASAARRILETRSKAADAAARSARQFELREEEVRSARFFEVRSEGNVDVVVLNSRHPIANDLCGKGEWGTSQQIQTLLGRIIASYYRAKNRFDDVEEVQPAQLFEALEHEWGVILNNYVTGSM